MESTDHVAVKVPPPAIFVGHLAGALLLNWALPLALPWLNAFRIAGGLGVVGGLSLAGLAMSHMIKAHTTPDSDRPTTALVIAGPYRLTRNPIYLGFFVVYLGFTFLAGTLWGILLSPFLLWTVTRAIIRSEELYLEARFPDSYREYKSRVRRWV